MKEKEAIAVGFFSDLESSWAATKLFREVVVVINVRIERPANVSMPTPF